MKPRFPAPLYTLLPQPRPGERETRFRPARDRSMNRPRREETRLV